jgi:hypothetical protein
MRSCVPRTALPGRSYSRYDQFAKGLGYFSIGLGVAELLAPQAVARAAGLEGRERLVRAYGAREIAQGIAILNTHDPTPWVWGRVAGDALDIVTVIAGQPDGNARKGNALASLAMLLGVTALDVYCADGLSWEKGDRKRAVADYHDRSGFPKGIEAARGAARDFRLPQQERSPDLVRSDALQRQPEQRQAAERVPAGSA